MSKMYICVLDQFPDYMTPTLVGHAVLRHHLQHRQDDVLYQEWVNTSFKKCVVKVNQKEFDKIVELPNVVLSWELNTLEGKVSCATIVVNEDIPNVLKFAKLWRPKIDSLD